jgi:hypothetical protein
MSDAQWAQREGYVDDTEWTDEELAQEEWEAQSHARRMDP